MSAACDGEADKQSGGAQGGCPGGLACHQEHLPAGWIDLTRPIIGCVYDAAGRLL